MDLKEFYEKRDRFTPHLDCINQELALFLMDVFEDLEMYLTLTDRAIVEAEKDKTNTEPEKPEGTLKEIGRKLKATPSPNYSPPLSHKGGSITNPNKFGYSFNYSTRFPNETD